MEDISDILANAPPEVDRITAQPSTIQPESVSTIQVTASDPDGDLLTFDYNATGGTIEGTGSAVTWQAPDQEGTYTITFSYIGYASSVHKIELQEGFQ